MKERISKIENDVQDKTSVAWQMLCAYIDKVADENLEAFVPLEALGPDMFSQIYTLPQSIAKLKNVKKVGLYGSNLKRIPPEIGEMESLEFFDPYTSYNLHWFPYEITNCKNLKNSRISTRALYGNIKNRMGFPRLNHNPVRYEGSTLKCSICKTEITYQQTNQLWISLHVGTDTIPLLVNVCSETCKNQLPAPPRNYVAFAHKGGADLKQPPDEVELFEMETAQYETELQKNQDKQNAQTTEENTSQKTDSPKDLPLLKLIKKIWE